MVIEVTKRQLADLIQGLELWKSEYEGCSQWLVDEPRIIKLLVKLYKYDK